jgi:hypothetical protein
MSNHGRMNLTIQGFIHKAKIEFVTLGGKREANAIADENDQTRSVPMKTQRGA